MRANVSLKQVVPGGTRGTSRSFHAWLDLARATDDPAGDFVDDMRRDRRLNPEFPVDFADFAAFRKYLARRTDDTDVLAAADEAWRRYESWLEKHPGAQSGAPGTVDGAPASDE